MGIKVITPPAAPCTLAEARLQCKVDSDDTTHDTYFSTVLIPAALGYAEHYTNRAIGSQTLELALDEFPADSIELPRGPVTSITSITYVDTFEATQTLSNTLYTLDDYSTPCWAVPAVDTDWPNTLEIANAVKVRYVVGDLPSAVKSAILLHIELESPLNPHTPAEREAMECARDALLDTVKIWGF